MLRAGTAKSTHRSQAQKRADAKVQAKVARQEPINPGEAPNLQEAGPGVDNGRFFHDNSSRYALLTKCSICSYVFLIHSESKCVC